MHSSAGFYLPFTFALQVVVQKPVSHGDQEGSPCGPSPVSLLKGLPLEYSALQIEVAAEAAGALVGPNSVSRPQSGEGPVDSWLRLGPCQGPNQEKVLGIAGCD